MVVKFFMRERKVGNFIYFLVILFILNFINNHGKQHKMLKKRPVADSSYYFFMCKRYVSKCIYHYCFILFILISYYFLILINDQSKQSNMRKNY